MNYKKEDFPKDLSRELYECAELAAALDERMNAMNKYVRNRNSGK